MNIDNFECAKILSCTNSRCIVKIKSVYNINKGMGSVLRQINERFGEVPSIYLSNELSLCCKNYMK
jgi:hypothetical protein